MKKIFLLTLSLVLTLGVMASSVTDIVAIGDDWTFIADDYTANGTSGWSNGTLYAGDHLLSLGGNSVATNKGSSTFGGGTHLNSLRIKTTQNRLAFAVSADRKSVV